MYDFILSCCGTIKTVDIFEQARIACTQVNWQVPPNQPFSRLIQIVVGRQPQYDSEAAYNSLLAHLEQDQQRKSASFILKNLIILDFIVQERAFLSRMGRYNNSQLLFPIQQSNAHSLSTAIRQLISSYYIYIKQKSKYYEIQSKQLVQAQNRQQYLSKSNSITILNEINICFKIQNLILDINSKYNKNINHKNGNANTNINVNQNVNQNGNYQNGSQSYQLVQFIFNLLLKTYIYCHSIVSIGLKVFVSRLFQLNRYDLQYIKKFVNYFNQQYTRNFIGFVAANPNIQSFKNLPVKQMIVNDQKMVAIIQTQLYNINNDPGICPEPQDLNSQILTSMARQIEKQKIQAIKTQDTFTEKSAQINQFQPLKTKSQPEQSEKQKDQKIKTQGTLAQKYESVQVNNSETLKTENQAVQQNTLAQKKIDNSQPITTPQNQKFEQQKSQAVKEQKQEALAKNLVQVNKFGSLNTQLQPDQVKKQQNQKQKAQDSQIEQQKAQKTKFIRRTEHAMPVQQLPQKEEVSVFEKYANFYSDMWTQEIKESDQRSFMNPKEIYSYYGVPIPENEQFENESDENGESEDESNSGEQNEDKLNNQQMEQAV